MCGLFKVAITCGRAVIRGIENDKLHPEPKTKRFAKMLRSFISYTEHRHIKENENQLWKGPNQQTTLTNEFVAVNSTFLERRYLAKL